MIQILCLIKLMTEFIHDKVSHFTVSVQEIFIVLN